MKKILIASLFVVFLLSAGMLFVGGKEEQTEEPAVGSAEAERSQDSVTVERKTDSSGQAVFETGKPDWLIENTSDQITIIDAAGRQVTIQKPIKRIVYNHVNAAEAINILGAWNMVVGGMIGSISPKLFPGIEEMPNCIASGNPFDIDYESVFELQPDIFLTLQSMIPGYNDVVEKLEPSIPVVALVNTADPDSFDTSVRMLGAILDEQEKAEEYISWCNSIKNEIGSRIESLSETDQPGVFLKTPGWTADQLCTLTNELLFCNSLFNGAGGINIANGLPSSGGWVENVDPEWIVEQDYDIIVIKIWMGLYPGALGYEVNDDSIIRNIREDIMTSELFAESRAIKNNKVYLHHSDLATTHRYIVGIAYWAKWFHPELFKELDPQAIHQEYLRKFMHVDLDLDSGGIIAYPED